MGERHSEYKRSFGDWYVEPAWAISALCDRVKFSGPIHDPCCGMGMIPKTLKSKHKMNVTGADITNRGFRYPVVDFLKDKNKRTNIIMNPPYKIAKAIINHAYSVATDRVAVIVQLKFLTSQGRHFLFNRPETEKVLIFSRRPQIPPGEALIKQGEGIRGGGSMDFCWVVWRRKHKGPATIEWVI